MTSQDGPNLTEFKEKMKQSHITRHFGVKRKSNSSCDVATLTDEDGKSEYFKNQSKKAKSCDKKRINLEQTNTEAATLPDCAKINDNEEDLDHEDRNKKVVPCSKEREDIERTDTVDVTLSSNSTSNFNDEVQWDSLCGPNLNCQYTILYKKSVADELLAECEKTIEYNTGKLCQVKIMGRWHDIPRKQVAQGSTGLSYNFSGNTVPARPWSPVIKQIRDRIAQLTGWDFNFVLINRYKDGDDHIGEHRDDEKDLVSGAPIASLSLGQSRDFIFRHKDTRGKNAKRNIPVKTIELKHGTLLMMNHPTNTYWYHSLPKRKACPGVRISLTFRVFKPQVVG